MLNPDHFVVTFARGVELFRTRPDAVPEQKTALRALVALSKLGDVTFALDGDALTVLERPVSIALPGVSALVVQLRVHGVTRVEIAKDAAPAELLKLVRGLAQDPTAGEGEDGFAAEMRTSQAIRVTTVTVPADAGPAEGREARVTDAFQAEGLVDPNLAAMEGFEPPPPPRIAMPEADMAGPAMAPPLPELPAPPSAPADTVPPAETVAPAAPAGALDEALDALRKEPHGGDVLGKLTAITDHVSNALRHDRIEEAVETLAAVLDLEAKVPEGSPKRSYAIALRRVLTKPTLEKVAEMVLDARHATDAGRVLVRAGEDGTTVLLDRLEKAAGIQERRAYYDALRSISDGIELLIPMLDHQEWYVAQSVAGLLGDLAVDDAVPALAKALEHSEPRVRQAAAVALAKIGGRSAVEPLRRALAGGDSEMRTIVAGAVSGRKSGALAMPLVNIAEESDDLDVRRECYRALGRIGTTDALQALIKAVQPGGILLGRKSADLRVAAIDGLKLVGGPVVIGTLEGLRDDRDKAVQEAARVALHELQP